MRNAAKTHIVPHDESALPKDAHNPQGHADANERRQNARYQSIYRVAKLRLNGQEQLCLVRNISSDGLMLDLYSPCNTGDSVDIDLNSDRTVSGNVVWTRADKAGVQFNEVVDVQDVLARDHEVKKSWVPRPPRLIMACPARLLFGALSYDVEISDISQGGVKFAFDQNLTRDARVILLIDDLTACPGTIRWQQTPYVGMAFNPPIALAALGTWVARIQQLAHPQQ